MATSSSSPLARSRTRTSPSARSSSPTSRATSAPLARPVELGLGAAAGEVALGVDQQVAAQVLREGEGVGPAFGTKDTT